MENMGYLFDIGFILALTFYCINLLISRALLGKVSHTKVRGTMFALVGIFDSLSIAFTSWVGGKMYGDVSRYSPLIISLVIYGFTTLYIIIYGYIGKLNY